jgi:hypothetical protein
MGYHRGDHKIIDTVTAIECTHYFIAADMIQSDGIPP